MFVMKGNIAVKYRVIAILDRIGGQGTTEILSKAIEFEEKNVRLRAARRLRESKSAIRDRI
jgi:hypothetical protein